MTTPHQAHAAALAPLTSVVDAVTGWDAPSPCAGWTARDVLDHLVATQRDFLTQHGAAPGPEVALADDPAGAWRAHSAAVADLLADDAVVGTTFDGFFGPTTVGEAFVAYYVWDMVVHRWDLARATGADPALSDAELDQVDGGADGFGPALHMDGICGPALDVPADADRLTRVLARVGRRA